MANYCYMLWMVKMSISEKWILHVVQFPLRKLIVFLMKNSFQKSFNKVGLLVVPQAVVDVVISTEACCSC